MVSQHQQAGRAPALEAEVEVHLEHPIQALEEVEAGLQSLESAEEEGPHRKA
jgi:hypothetical protein